MKRVNAAFAPLLFCASVFLLSACQSQPPGEDEPPPPPDVGPIETIHGGAEEPPDLMPLHGSKDVTPRAPPQQAQQTTPTPAPTTAPPAPAPTQPGGTQVLASGSPGGSEFKAGPAIVAEFPNVHSAVSGTISGSGSLTNDTPRVSAGLSATWTSPQLNADKWPIRWGFSAYLGVPINGGSTASGVSSGGFDEQLQVTPNSPIFVPSIFASTSIGWEKMGVNFGAWVENTKETVSLSMPGFRESDTHSSAVVRPFVGVTLVNGIGMPVANLGSRWEDFKLSAGYIFPTVSTFQSNFCPGGFSCIRTTEHGSFYVMGGFNFSFAPIGVAPPPR